jgi:hypothetical protein
MSLERRIAFGIQHVNLGSTDLELGQNGQDDIAVGVSIEC